MGPVKIIMTLWTLWKKPIKLLVKDPEDAQDLDDGTTDDIYYEKIEMLFNSTMTEFFCASDISDLIERMLATSRHKLKILYFLRVVLHYIK